MDDTERSRSGDDRALDDPVFSDLFDAMRAASSGPAPAMGPELSAMVSGAGVASLTARRTRVRTAIVGLAVIGAVAGGAGAAAAAGVSPSHAARFATSIIQRMPGVDSGPAGVEEDTTRGIEQRESPPPTSTRTRDDEPSVTEESSAQVSPTYRPSGVQDDEQSRQTSGLAPGEDEHTAAGEASSTDASDDGDGSQTPSTDTDERTAPSSTSTEDDAGSETSRDTDDSSGTSQEQSGD
jgi:hypothetical protein